MYQNVPKIVWATSLVLQMHTDTQAYIRLYGERMHVCMFQVVGQCFMTGEAEILFYKANAITC